MIADIGGGPEAADAIARDYGANSVASAVTDVSDETAVEALVARTIERFGKIDVLVNNAALYAPLQEQQCTEIDAATWDRVMAVNLRGPFLMVKHVSPHMIAQGYGKIINIGSGTAFKGIPRMLHYVTSKGGIMAFTRALSRELGEHGIRVNTLSPGFIRSDTVMAENPRHAETAGKCYPPQRLSAGPSWRAGVFGGGRQRFHHGPDHRRRRRQREYVKGGPTPPA
jgi:NAD(P)-dependent dehydrogenase (short-subunit alcohol dehydrogenase family)